jgi:cytochrome b subunit of formate dehydrogenase
MPSAPPQYIYYLFPVFFASLWIFNCYLLALLSGWRSLAKKFADTTGFNSYQWKSRSARFHVFVGIRDTLDLGVDHNGLHLSVVFFFRAFMKPLCIPWSEIQVASYDTGWLFKTRKFLLGREQQVPFQISSRLAQQLKSSAGPLWPTEANNL